MCRSGEVATITLPPPSSQTNETAESDTTLDPTLVPRSLRRRARAARPSSRARRRSWTARGTRSRATSARSRTFSSTRSALILRPAHGGRSRDDDEGRRRTTRVPLQRGSKEEPMHPPHQEPRHPSRRASPLMSRRVTVALPTRSNSRTCSCSTRRVSEKEQCSSAQREAGAASRTHRL